MAIIAGLETANTVVSTVSSIFGLGNPKDEKRKQQADSLYQRALSGDAAALVQLQCLSGDQAARPEAVRLGFLTQEEIARGTPCGYATTEAKNYAKQLITKLRTQKAVAQTAAVVTAGAAQVGTTAHAPTYAATTAAIAAPKMVGAIPVWVWAAVGLGVIYVVSRR